MTTPRQLHANRQNAQRSTGPKTPEGKSTVAQNGIKHGLTSSQNLIKGESQAEFDLYSEQLYKEHDPVGSMETHLVERIITIIWRLKRVIRAQTAALNSLHYSHNNKPVIRGLDAILKPKNDSPPPPDHEFGEVIVKDTVNSKVIDNLLLQERRLENSLFRTIAELERKQMIRKLDIYNSKNKSETTKK
ncbi:MAG TPA: hypothetical protein ENH94_00755 [Phycisphaerales bacterium]|nr:hypothetical protein [Phycisphaerales bacterium]